MKLSTNEKAVYAIFLLVLIMVNPPIVNIVRPYQDTSFRPWMADTPGLAERLVYHRAHRFPCRSFDHPVMEKRLQ